MNGIIFRTSPLLVFLILLLWGLTVFGQAINFKPLERGEYEEEEEKLFILRGIKVGGDYAISLRRDKHNEIPADQNRTSSDQDFRLDLRTVFHRDIEMHLVLETQPSEFDSTRLRSSEDQEGQSQTTESPALGLNAREASLRYRFNPRSMLVLGKQEISLGDRRGKTFHGIAPGATYDCKIGTWCMPFGALKIGEEASDWIFHWALEYTAWEAGKKEELGDTLRVEIFRILYTENNIPMGTNSGPAFFNRNDPDNSGALHPSQASDSAGNPIYYDAEEQDYWGLRVNWFSGAFFLNFDAVYNQGKRRLHRYRSDAPAEFLDFDGNRDYSFRQVVSGIAVESEIGGRWNKGRAGLRFLNASGDPPLTPGAAGEQIRGIDGFFEITPGSYQGTRLYFNGSDATVESGGGLGHSVNNTQMYGFFYEFTDPDDLKMDYTFGLFRLERIHPVYDALGLKRKAIGTELNNLLSFHIHKALRLQFEVNAINTGKAFAVDDYSAPTGLSNNYFLQGFVRLVYNF